LLTLKISGLCEEVLGALSFEAIRIGAR
jgi:hypothetical protein